MNNRQYSPFPKQMPFIRMWSQSRDSKVYRTSYDPAPVSTDGPLEFWYQRYNGAVPDFSAETVVAQKKMTVISNIGNPSFSWGADYEAAALQFQAANGNPRMVLSQAFWGQTAGLADAWPTSESEWSGVYPTRRLTDTPTRIMMIDLEPTSAAIIELIGAIIDGKYGTAGTAQQIADATAYVAAKEKFQYALPELRGPSTRVSTNAGSHYTILPAFGTRRINEGSYDPSYTTLDGVDDVDIVGVRVSTDGHTGNYTPEAAKLVFPTRDKMYFPVVSLATESLIGDAYYTALKAEMLEIANRL